MYLPPAALPRLRQLTGWHSTAEPQVAARSCRLAVTAAALSPSPPTLRSAPLLRPYTAAIIMSRKQRECWLLTQNNIKCYFSSRSLQSCFYRTAAAWPSTHRRRSARGFWPEARCRRRMAVSLSRYLQRMLASSHWSSPAPDALPAWGRGYSRPSKIVCLDTFRSCLSCCAVAPVTVIGIHYTVLFVGLEFV